MSIRQYIKQVYYELKNIYNKMQHQTGNFELFRTQTQPSISNYEANMGKMKDYVNRLDMHINKAMNSQNNIIKHKKRQIDQQLGLIKERIVKESLRSKKMQEYFVKYCENILKEDITKWHNNGKFYKDLFNHFENKINENQQRNKCLHQQIKELKISVKSSMQEVRNMYLRNHRNTENFYNQKTQQTKPISQLQEKPNRIKTISTRIKTDLSLPTLPRNMDSSIVSSQSYLPTTKRIREDCSLLQGKITRLKTQYIKSSQNQMNYMQPIKTIKISQLSSLNRLSKWLDEYREQAMKNENLQWFQKVLFNARNYQKLKKYLEKNTVLRKKRVKTDYLQ